MKAFVEYRIEQEYRQAYLDLIADIIMENSDLEIYEGTEQPNLFIEIWNHCNYQSYENMKKERKGGTNPKWKAIESWVVGGRDKINIWHFSKI